MKMGKRELVVSLAMLGGAVAWNVWVYTTPARTSTTRLRAPAPVDALPALPTADTAGATQIDPTTITARGDVALDREPVFPRNPFVDAHPPKPAEVAEAAAPAAPAEATVSTILYGDARKLAIVNGHIVGAGDAVGSERVVEVQRDGVVLDGPLGRRTVTLRAPLTTAATKGRK